jgi:hypothetical protein
MSIMIKNVYPVKDVENILQKFDTLYRDFIKVSFNIIKPKFTKSY